MPGRFRQWLRVRLLVAFPKFAGLASCPHGHLAHALRQDVVRNLLIQISRFGAGGCEQYFALRPVPVWLVPDIRTFEPTGLRVWYQATKSSSFSARRVIFPSASRVRAIATASCWALVTSLDRTRP